MLSFAVAFIAGAIFSKAFFSARAQAGDLIDRDKHHALLKAQRSRYRKRVSALHNLVRRHEAKQRHIKEKLIRYRKAIESRDKASLNARSTIAKLQSDMTAAQESAAEFEKERTELTTRFSALENDLKAEQAKLVDAKHELERLRNEREELNAGIQRLEQDQYAASAAAIDATSEEIRAEMDTLRETLAARDQTIRELNAQLEDSHTQKGELEDRLETLNQRVSPLTQKLQEQRQLLRQLRQVSAGTADTTIAEDDLKEIRGIGPALERKLRSHGIEQFAQLAAMSEEELADLSSQLSIAPNMGRRQGWIRQARDLHRNLHGSG
jgi:predicted flap endonuclease-1-like 5' DNA nuclease